MTDKFQITPGRYAVGEIITWTILGIAILWLGDSVLVQLGALVIAAVLFLLLHYWARPHRSPEEESNGKKDD